MKLERLEITRLQGISSGFCLQDLADDINLVTGPNAIGKSSLVRALQLLLQDSQKSDPLVTLAAEFSEGDKRWRVDRTGQQIDWTCNGQVSPPPRLPSADQLARYCLSMEDLIKADATDNALAQELQRSLRGGFDLNSVRAEIGPRHGTHEKRRLDEALDTLRQAERRFDALHGRQETIPKLTSSIDEALHAEKQVHLIGQARQLLNAIGASNAANARLAEFPKQMDKLTGKELEGIESLRDRIKTREDELREHKLAQRQSEELLAASGLAATDLEQAETDFAALGETLQDIKGLLQEQRREERARTEQKASLDTAAKALGGNAPPGLDRENLTQAEGFANDVLDLRERKRQIEQRLNLVGEAPDDQQIHGHRKAAEALRDWLGAQSEAPSRRAPTFLLWTSLALTLASLAALFLLPIPVPIGLLSLLMLVILVALWKQGLNKRGEEKTKAQFVMDRFGETGITPPVWNSRGVRERLKAVEDSLATLEAQRKMAEGASALRAELKDVDVRLAEKDQAQQGLAETLGFDPLIPLTGLDRFVHLARQWDEACRSLESTNRYLAELDRKIKAAMVKTRSALSRWPSNLREDCDFEQLSAACEALRTRLHGAREAIHGIRLVGQQVAAGEAEIARDMAEIAKIYQGAGLNAEEHEVLVDRLRHLESWKAARNELIQAEALEKRSREALEGKQDLLRLVDLNDESVLENSLIEKKRIAEQLEDLRNERAGVEADVELAQGKHALEDAIAGRVEAQAILEQRRDELLAHKASQLLLGRVVEDYRTTHEPEVLRHANALFQEVTAHDFELRLGENGDLLAWDTRQNAMRELPELSTGTRMQLLLAVRVAWVRSQSVDGRMLPLFLDEALTTSDEFRFISVAQSLDQISALSGLQVIYLSARRHERDLWSTALGRDPHSIDLAAIRGQGDGDEVPRFEVTPLEPIPKPMGNASEYARQLGVLPVDPMLDAGEIHLFHLLRDDLDLLHRYLDSLRISSLGQLESYLQREEPDHPHLLERCRAARAWVAAWREGRGRSIGTLELEASGAFSQRYLKEASALVNSQDISGDANLLLAALRGGALKGFQTKKIDDYEAWLNEHQFLDDRAVLSRDERQQRVLGSYDLKQHDRIGDIAQCIGWLEAGVVEIEGAPK